MIRRIYKEDSSLGAPQYFDLKNLEQLQGIHFISNEYFAVPDEPSLHDQESNFSIHKIDSGAEICKLQSNSDFIFIRNTTSPVEHGPQVIGIFDKKTYQFYDISIASLLHLGADSLHLTKNDPILRTECVKTDEKRLMVLGKHAPGLYFINLLAFDALSYNQKSRKIEHEIWKYSIM
jgi:hypothetical protein